MHHACSQCHRGLNHPNDLYGMRIDRIETPLGWRRALAGDFLIGSRMSIPEHVLRSMYGVSKEFAGTSFGAVQKTLLRNGRACRHIVITGDAPDADGECALECAEDYTGLADAMVAAVKRAAEDLAGMPNKRVLSVADLFADPLMAFPERQRTAIWSFRDDAGADTSVRWSADGTQASFDVWVAIKDDGRVDCEASPHRDDCPCRKPAPVLRALTLHMSRLPSGKRAHDADEPGGKRVATDK